MKNRVRKIFVRMFIILKVANLPALFCERSLAKGMATNASAKFFEDLNQMNQIIASSAQEMKKYKENAEKLNAHLDSLNSIYGNMLGAMNYKKK